MYLNANYILHESFLRHWLTNEYHPWWETWQLSNKWLHYQCLIFREHALVWQRFLVVGFTSLLFFLCPSKSNLSWGKKKQKKNKRGVLRCWQDDVDLLLTVYHCTFWKLTKEFACKQLCADLGMKIHKVENSVCKDFLFQKPDVGFAYQREWDTSIPSSTRSKPWLSMNCNEPPSFSARNSAEIKAEEA